jgi:hypothetical protein
MDIEYSGITRNSTIKTLDDGTFLVTVDQRKIIDPVLKKTEREQIIETAADRNELFHILGRCYPDEE